MSRILARRLCRTRPDQAMSQLGGLFELTWRPIVTRSMTIKDEGGHPFDVDCHVTFSLGGPFAGRGLAGHPRHTPGYPATGWLHHLGYWVEDYPAERQRLTHAGLSSPVPHLRTHPAAQPRTGQHPRRAVRPAPRPALPARSLPARLGLFGEPVFPAHARNRP